MDKDYYKTGRVFKPEIGGTYENAGGGLYVCVSNVDWSEDDSKATLVNFLSRWTFEAHGIKRYIDGHIEWDYSTGGRFVK